jgi:tRNA (guanine-N7-)-methyltransferase
MIKPEFNRRDIRSFVIRGGRITDAQEKAFERYWPTYGLQLGDGPLDFQQVFGNHQPVVLEIGYGMGDSLLTMAQQETDKNFIGIEVHPPGVGRLVNEAGKRQLANLRSYCADAVDVLEKCIPDHSLARVQLYFPDPWHKKRHHKRRILQPPFAEQIARKLVPGGLFHLCTDWTPYAEYMLEVLNNIPALANVSADKTWVDKPAWRPGTKFEKRGLSLGHAVHDLLFERCETGLC